MILFLSNLPVSEQAKISELILKVKSAYGTDFFDVGGQRWFGDNITVESLFPNWILKKYEEDPDNVLIVSIVKNYLRWLFSIEYGYGAQLNWETIRVPIYMNEIFLLALADFYFPGSDFDASPLKEVLPNIRKFSIKCPIEYYPIKGTPAAIKYLATTLLGIPWNKIYIETPNSATIGIKVDTQYYSSFIEYDSFMREFVYPAGISVIIGSVTL